LVIEKDRKSLPPYVSYRTFRNFIDGLQMGMPSRIDRSYWGERLSGSNGIQLMTALRFLGLIDSDGIPQTRLRQLVSARGIQRSEVLKQIAYTTFSFLAERALDPQAATYSQLEEAFYNTYQVTGDVARKCIKFFVSLESDAGIILSPFIMKKSKTLRADGVRKKILKKPSSGTIQNSVISPVTDSIPTRLTWYEMVLAKFPTFDPAWSDEVKLKWFEAFDALLKKSSSGTEK
jgi:hypothetical protein